jgi:hypothetical protein
VKLDTNEECIKRSDKKKTVDPIINASVPRDKRRAILDIELSLELGLYQISELSAACENAEEY